MNKQRDEYYLCKMISGRRILLSLVLNHESGKMTLPRHVIEEGFPSKHFCPFIDIVYSRPADDVWLVCVHLISVECIVSDEPIADELRPFLAAMVLFLTKYNPDQSFIPRELEWLSEQEEQVIPDSAFEGSEWAIHHLVNETDVRIEIPQISPYSGQCVHCGLWGMTGYICKECRQPIMSDRHAEVADWAVKEKKSGVISYGGRHRKWVCHRDCNCTVDKERVAMVTSGRDGPIVWFFLESGLNLMMSGDTKTLVEVMVGVARYWGKDLTRGKEGDRVRSNLMIEETMDMWSWYFTAMYAQERCHVSTPFIIVRTFMAMIRGMGYVHATRHVEHNCVRKHMFDLNGRRMGHFDLVRMAPKTGVTDLGYRTSELVDLSNEIRLLLADQEYQSQEDFYLLYDQESGARGSIGT